MLEWIDISHNLELKYIKEIKIPKGKCIYKVKAVVYIIHCFYIFRMNMKTSSENIRPTEITGGHRKVISEKADPFPAKKELRIQSR